MSAISVMPDHSRIIQYMNSLSAENQTRRDNPENVMNRGLSQTSWEQPLEDDLKQVEERGPEWTLLTLWSRKRGGLFNLDPHHIWIRKLLAEHLLDTVKWAGGGHYEDKIKINPARLYIVTLVSSNLNGTVGRNRYQIRLSNFVCTRFGDTVWYLELNQDLHHFLEHALVPGQTFLVNGGFLDVGARTLRLRLVLPRDRDGIRAHKDYEPPTVFHFIVKVSGKPHNLRKVNGKHIDFHKFQCHYYIQNGYVLHAVPQPDPDGSYDLEVFTAKPAPPPENVALDPLILEQELNSNRDQAVSQANAAVGPLTGNRPSKPRSSQISVLDLGTRSALREPYGSTGIDLVILPQTTLAPAGSSSSPFPPSSSTQSCAPEPDAMEDILGQGRNAGADVSTFLMSSSQARAPAPARVNSLAMPATASTSTGNQNGFAITARTPSDGSSSSYRTAASNQSWSQEPDSMDDIMAHLSFDESLQSPGRRRRPRHDGRTSTTNESMTVDTETVHDTMNSLEAFHGSSIDLELESM